MDEELIKVGRYNQEYNKFLGLNMDAYDIYYSPGIEVHMRKRHHIDCIPYISRLNEIISSPDYVGKSPKEPNSIELVKTFDNNVMVGVKYLAASCGVFDPRGIRQISMQAWLFSSLLAGIKVDTSKNYMYISTMYCIQDSKVRNRVNGGRLKKL